MEKRKWLGGPVEKRQKNVGKYDMIRCEKIIEAKGPNIRIKCNSIMKIQKVLDAGIQFKSGQARCTAFNGHRIQTKHMYVAICRNVQHHLDGEINVCCRVCIENFDYYHHHEHIDPSFDIVRKFFKYKRKKNRK